MIIPGLDRSGITDAAEELCDTIGAANGALFAALAALSEVEYVESWPDHQHRCAWCDRTPMENHAKDCARQYALALIRDLAGARTDDEPVWQIREQGTKPNVDIRREL